MLTTLDLPQEIVAEAEGVASARKTTLQGSALRTVLRAAGAASAQYSSRMSRPTTSASEWKVRDVSFSLTKWLGDCFDLFHPSRP